MDNLGGTITAADQWQLVMGADPTRSGATVQNTALGLDRTEFNPNGINSGPAVEVWPYADDPTESFTDTSGALLLARPGDAIELSGTDAQGAIYVRCARAGARFAASASFD